MKLERSDLQLETIVTRILNDELDLQPEFQRGEIWDKKRKQRLIDTVLREWYVPAVHIVVDSEGNDLVLDGQQRLVALREFFQDEFPVDGNIEPADSSVSSLDRLYYSELPERVRRTVNRFPLQTVTLREYLPPEPNELFFRLNQGYNLTPPEKRNALHGPARDQVKMLVLKLTDEGLLDRSRIGFANSRLAYDDIVARSCVAIEFDDMRLHINNSVVEKHYRKLNSFRDETIDRVAEAGRALLDQLSTCAVPVRFNKGTLQTWLVYCSWAGPLPPNLLGSFEHERTLVRRGEIGTFTSDDSPLLKILQIYDDRASYRVTDVSSVLARDLAIHLYSRYVFDTPERRQSSTLLSRIAESGMASAQTEFFNYMQAVEWGNPIVGGRSR